MIVLCAGEISQKSLDAMVLFARQLGARGHHAVIDERFVPDDASRQLTFELAPFVADLSSRPASLLIVLGASSISETPQALISRILLEDDARVWGFGHFESFQDQITARNRIAYATGREPQINELVDQKGCALYEATLAPLLTEIRDAPAQKKTKAANILLYYPFPETGETDEAEVSLSHFSEMHFSPNVALHLLTNSRGKAAIDKSSSSWCSVFSYMELPPLSLLKYFDILVFLGTDVPGHRMAALSINAMGAGKVVIDCTSTGAFAATGAPVLRGPTEQVALASYLRDVVLKSRVEIGNRTLQSTWLHDYDIASFERKLELAPESKPLPIRAARRLFFPTNGNGLGHAQRCALVAERTEGGASSVFAAFPSCVTFLRKRGFGCVPMVSRTDQHVEEHASDVLNYIRLRQFVLPGDQFVFDGGYVFDSVYRLVSDLDLRATWIRRGLWQSRQVNRIALERERAFETVIVPAEAFDELNTDYSNGDHVCKVGPIVQESASTTQNLKRMRDRLSVEFDSAIDTLVVSMLGGGVASRRAAHTQLLCSLVEGRPNTLHLVLAWPNATVDSALYSWTNSHVVRTSHAIEFCRMADLCVSAAGYNSFHELLYARVPAILVPQSASFLDDQERRAQAAADRQLAVVVKENELFKLEREALAFIESGKGAAISDALRKEQLPPPGNSEAARIIEKGFTN